MLTIFVIGFLLYIYAVTAVIIWYRLFRKPPENNLETRLKKVEDQVQALQFK